MNLILKKRIDFIEKAISQDLGSRGLISTCTRDNIEIAAHELMKSSTVLIVTGFLIKTKLVGETDGPLGAVMLAFALRKLGKDVALVTDTYSYDLLLAACNQIDLDIAIEVIKKGNDNAVCYEHIYAFRPSHVVSIERPAKARDGKLYSMLGLDFSDLVPYTDALFLYAKNIGAATIAIGDGGNEMGMGKIADIVCATVSKGNLICAVSVADYLIVSGVSNWGVYGLVGVMSLLSGDMLLHDSSTEKEALRAIVEAGAVDGCSKISEMTVYGISLEDNLKILDTVRNVVIEYLSN